MPKKRDKDVKNKRVDWEENAAKIRQTIVQYVADNQKPPTQAEIAELSKLSPQAVNRHMKEINLAQVISGATKKMAVLSDDVMFSIFLAATQGNAASQKLWFQLLGWSEKQTNVLQNPDGSPLYEGLADVLVAARTKKRKTAKTKKAG